MQLKSASHTNPVELFKSDGGSAWALLTAWEGYFAAEPESQRALHKSAAHWSLPRAAGSSSEPAAQLLLCLL